MLINLEHAIFRFFNAFCQLELLDKVMPYITELGTAGVLITAVILLFFRRSGKAICGILLMAGLAAVYHLGNFIKDIIARPRPFLVLPDVNVLVKVKSFSCPSTHSAMAFMAAFVLTKHFRRWYIFYPLAVLVAISRMYLGVHYPSDVIAGAVLGIFVGFVLVRCAEPKR